MNVNIVLAMRFCHIKVLLTYIYSICIQNIYLLDKKNITEGKQNPLCECRHQYLKLLLLEFRNSMRRDREEFQLKKVFTSEKIYFSKGFFPLYILKCISISLLFLNIKFFEVIHKREGM